jgi:predicted MFS family arabinose efflux permease
MDAPDLPEEEVTRTPARGWAVLLLFRAQHSSVILISYTFGLFLPFIRDDLAISPLEAGLLQGVWWLTAATVSLPSGAWFSRFRPVPLVLASLLLSLPFLFMQALATGFAFLLLARFFFVLCHVIATPARTLLLQQWAAPRQYAQINSVGLSQHSVILALAVSTSALLITGFGSWRIAYLLIGGLLLAQTLAWVLVARERKAPVHSFQTQLNQQEGTPLRALVLYPQGWIIAAMMFFLSATWTATVTFLPTLWLEERGVSLTLGGPLLGFLYYGLIPSGLFGGFLAYRVTNRKLLLGIPALLNVLFGVAITVTPNPILLMFLITGLGLVWVATPAINVLPFEFPGIRPRQVAVISSLIVTFSGLGFAAGPVVTGLVAQLTGSLQTGLVTLCLLTGLGVVVSAFYPGYARRTVLPA